MGCLDVVRVFVLGFVFIPVALGVLSVVGLMGLFLVVAFLALPLAFLLAA